MQSCKEQSLWEKFLSTVSSLCSQAEFRNWLEPIEHIETTEEKIVLNVPNVFVQQYLLENYREELKKHLPCLPNGEPAIEFRIPKVSSQFSTKSIVKKEKDLRQKPAFNKLYTFENFIEGPSNQFVKSAALGVAYRPGKSFNPLFIHGGVGLGKTHLLHGIGHYIFQTHKKLKLQCITTEALINELVQGLKQRSIEKMKHFYRSVDVLLIDDIQFLQNRLNFEEEFCNTFETLIHQNKQIVLTSDKPPSQLKLSERMIARMEWGLVAHIGVPELETRVAIVEQKAALKGVTIPNAVAFFIADHIYSNVRQLEGAINRLSAFAHLMHKEVTIELAENLLKEFLTVSPSASLTLKHILKSVATVFEVKISDITGDSRLKNIALARQVAMYLAKELLDDSLSKLAGGFGGKTHSTLLHAWKKISVQEKSDSLLKRQIAMIKKNLQL